MLSYYSKALKMHLSANTYSTSTSRFLSFHAKRKYYLAKEEEKGRGAFKKRMHAPVFW
jgi:hypothetical protein